MALSLSVFLVDSDDGDKADMVCVDVIPDHVLIQ